MAGPVRIDPARVRSFATPAELTDWLDGHAGDWSELWVRIAKVGTGEPSVTWQDCVRAALAVGWIDGMRKPDGPRHFCQRLTPRKARSAWSKRNREIAEALIAEGRMRPAGLAQVETAKADGRWDAAYSGSSEMEIPADFLGALAASPKAQATFATLNRQNLYAIYYRVTTAKRPATRASRIAALVATLAQGERFH